nr:MAG TPA: hypothetical protein [Caudoviricetes sp.]
MCCCLISSLNLSDMTPDVQTKTMCYFLQPKYCCLK